MSVYLYALVEIIPPKYGEDVKFRAVVENNPLYSVNGKSALSNTEIISLWDILRKDVVSPAGMFEASFMILQKVIEDKIAELHITNKEANNLAHWLHDQATKGYYLILLRP